MVNFFLALPIPNEDFGYVNHKFIMTLQCLEDLPLLRISISVITIFLDDFPTNGSPNFDIFFNQFLPCFAHTQALYEIFWWQKSEDLFTYMWKAITNDRFHSSNCKENEKCLWFLTRITDFTICTGCISRYSLLLGRSLCVALCVRTGCRAMQSFFYEL